MRVRTAAAALPSIALALALAVVLAAPALAADPSTTRPATRDATQAAAAFTERDVIAGRLALENEFVVDAYKKSGHRDARWDADAIALLAAQVRGALDAGASRFARLDDVVPAAARAALADKIVAAGCDDAIVLFEAGRAREANGDVDGAGDAFRAAAARVDAAPYASLFKLLIVDAAANPPVDADAIVIPAAPNGPNGATTRMVFKSPIKVTPPPRPVVRDPRFAALARATLADAAMLPRHRDAVARTVRGVLLSGGGNVEQYKAGAAVGDAVDGAPGADPWLYEYVIGCAEVDRAWADRGNEMGDKVTPAGWAGFKRHLALAREHLRKAIAADAARPQPYAAMITVAMGDGSGEERKWFDAGRARQPDSTVAASTYLNALRPKWGGSHQQMFQAGADAVKAGHFDTGGPAMVFEAIRQIEDDAEDNNDPQPESSYAKYYLAVSRCLDGYIAQNAVDAPGARPDVRRWARSARAAWASRLEKWAEAQAQFAALAAEKLTPDEAVFTETSVNLANVRPVAAARGGSYAGDVAEAMKKPPADRAAALAAVQAKVDAADTGRAWLTAEIAKAKLDAVASATGRDYRPLPIEPSLEGWTPQAEGKWSVDADGALVATGGKMSLITAPYDLPDRYDLRLTIEPPHGPAKYKLADVYVRGNTADHFGYSVSLNFVAGTGTVNLTTKFPLPAKDTPVTLTLRIVDETLLLLGPDGKPLAKDTPRGNGNGPGGGAITLRGDDGKPLKIRISPDGKIEMDTDAKQKAQRQKSTLRLTTQTDCADQTWRFTKIEIRSPK